MAQITFNVELDPKENKLGVHEIRIRITQNRKHKRFNVGYAVEKKQWDSVTQQVNKKHPLQVIINAAISSKKQDIEKEYLLSIPTKQQISLNQLYKKAKKDIFGLSYIEFFEEHISEMENPSTAIGFRKVLGKLKTYLNGSDLFFEEIDFEFLQKFLKYLKGLGNAENTIHHNFKTIRSVYNHAVKKRRFMPAFVSPFYGHEVKRKKVKRNKLDENDIERFENYEAPEGIQKFHAHKFFLLCYYLLGVRSSSMVKMKWKNIKGDRCIYDPAKGQDRKDVVIGKKAQEILNYYAKRYEKKPNPDDYIFPFLTHADKKLEGEELVRKLDAINSNINNQLTEISVELELNKKITTHVARHSFAYNSRRKSGNDIYAVQQALGHSSVVITEAYFSDEENSDSDKLSKLMFE